MKSIYFAFLFLISVATQAQTLIWNNLLQQHVNNKGWVDYNGFSKDEKKLDIYLTSLKNTHPEKLASKNAKKAFWINAYNAYTIKLILNHYPLKSILDIKVDGKGAWDIPFVKVGGKTYTLNHIEHEILRKKYTDPKIHVGVNCASISCPALPNTAFTEKNIDSLLNKGIKAFINDKTRNIISASHLELSQIFNWFKDDFTQQSDLITFINKYSSTKIESSASIQYKEYNWNLNKQ